MNNKVVIIGCGNVGMSYAYALINQRTYVNKLILIDINIPIEYQKNTNFGKTQMQDYRS